MAVADALTELGASLLQQILALSGWVQARLTSLEASRSALDARQVSPDRSP